MIEIKGIRKVYQMGDIEVSALNSVSLTIEQGDFVAIMGPSGSGKSTLMHILGLLDQPDGGSYKLLGKEVSQLNQDELATLRSDTVGFVFQQFNLLPRTSALDNVRLPLLYAKKYEDEDWARELLSDVGLGSRTHHKPNELSGGQQQRVAIARSLVNRPKIIFADEPTGNLDSKSEKEIMDLLTRLNDTGITIVLVTHEPEMARYVKRVIKMRDGTVQSDELNADRHPSPPVEVADVDLDDAQIIPLAARFWNAVTEPFIHFKQAIKSLLANKVRSVLSMLGILIGVAAVIAMLALGNGARESIKAQLSSLGSNLLVLRSGTIKSGGVSLGAGTNTRFTMDDAKEIRDSIRGAKRISPTVTGRAQSVYQDKNWNTQVQGSGPDYPEMRAAAPIAGRFFTEEEDRTRARLAVLGTTVVRNLFGETNPVGEWIKINKVNFQVIGILPEKGATAWNDQDDVIVIPVTTAMRRLLGRNFLDSIDIEAENPEYIDGLQQQLKQLIMTRHKLRPGQEEAFQIRNMADIQAALSETSRVMSWLLASIASISLLVGGIGIMNIMLVSVTERTKEIGLRKAIGAKRKSILTQFLIEAVVISLAGGLIGIALGCSVAFGLSSLAGWPATVSLASVLVSAIFSAGIGIVFGLWPALQASRLHPIEALRFE